ncbi:MAG: hypothetical protein M1833_002691 [Piccolia ochrophora]|nr:MAG: hypothetical protein M1833_002691 [Piccolia ochrophora]
MPIIGSGQKRALLEAYGAAVSLLPSPLRSEFLVVGGTSLLIIGSNRKTEDVDFAVSIAAFAAFEEAASDNPRFSKGSVADWTYTCQGEGIEDVNVPLEFLRMGGGFAPHIKVIKPVGDSGGFRAGLGELARMKANAYMARAQDKDLEDFCFLLDSMDETEGFEGVQLEDEDFDDMEATAADCGRGYPNHLRDLLRIAHR